MLPRAMAATVGFQTNLVVVSTAPIYGGGRGYALIPSVTTPPLDIQLLIVIVIPVILISQGMFWRHVRLMRRKKT